MIRRIDSLVSDDPEDEANLELELEYEETIKELDFNEETQSEEEEVDEMLDDYFQRNGW